jgi:PKD repeat protein
VSIGVTLDTRTNQVFTANFQKLAYSFTNTTAYNLYRFQIDRVANPAQAVAMQLDELEFLLVPAAYSYSWAFGDGATSTNQNPQHTYAANGTYTATMVVSDGLSTATNTIPIHAALPEITISGLGQGMATFSWPTWATGYALYSTTRLAPPIIWSPVTNALSIVGDQYVVTLPIDPTVSYFFQLQRAVNGVGNVVVGNVRVQLLSDSLVRLEFKGSGGFEDRPTFHVASRDFPGVSFTSNLVSGQVVIATTNFVVRVPQPGTSLAGVQVDSPLGQVLYSYNGVLTNSVWLPGPSQNPTVWAAPVNAL